MMSFFLMPKSLKERLQMNLGSGCTSTDNSFDSAANVTEAVDATEEKK